jgi:hypothetical protein
LSLPRTVAIKHPVSAGHKSEVFIPSDRLCSSSCSTTTPDLAIVDNKRDIFIDKLHALTFMFAIALCCGVSLGHKCQNITISLNRSVRNGDFTTIIPQNGIDVTKFTLHAAAQGRNYSQVLLTNHKTATNSYSISATRGIPERREGKVLQILTHGTGFDRSSWVLAFNNFNYSYMATAVDQYGFLPLSWDRLSVANSTHGDPLAAI